MCEGFIYALIASEPASQISHEGYITIMLTGLGVAVGLEAVTLAVFAFFGYRALADEVIRKAIAKADSAARNVSIKTVTAKAVEAAERVAAEVAERTVIANKDKWLSELELSVQLAEAQSEAQPQASDREQAVSGAYPGEGEADASTNIPEPNGNTGADNPPPPGDTPR